MNRRERRHPSGDHHPWDDFSFRGYIGGWGNPHRRWRGHSVFWASGVAVVFFAAIFLVGWLLPLLIGN